MRDSADVGTRQFDGLAGVTKEVDRESALEMLRARAGLGGLIFGTTGPRGGKRDGLVDLMAKSAARSAGSALSRTLLRAVLGSLLGGRRS